MTNEEKSKLLSPCAFCWNICKVHGVERNEPCNTYYALVEMAEWKDEQIKNKIEQFFAEHNDYDYVVNYMDDYVDMDRLKTDLINFIGL